MHQVRFRFYEELNRNLPEEKRKIGFDFDFSGEKSIGEALSILNVPVEQIKDLVNHLDLSSIAEPFTRCLPCSSQLVPVEKQEIKQRLQAQTTKYYREFLRCVDCDQLFWKGSHFEHMQEFINKNKLSGKDSSQK